MTMNVFNSQGTAYLGPQAWAFDRTKMLADQPATLIAFPRLGPSFPPWLPADLTTFSLFEWSRCRMFYGVLRGEAAIMTRKPTLLLIVFAQIFGVGLPQVQSSNVIGSWRVEVTFRNAQNRSLCFEARESGKGTFLLLDPGSKFRGLAGPSEATWTQGDGGSVMFSGTVEFPLGNVGRDAGTLVLKGKFGTDGSIAGEAMFFPSDQDPKDPKAKPSKSGTFKAIRVTG